jgi:hypothetical protein
MARCVAVQGQAPAATGAYAPGDCLLGRVTIGSERRRVEVWHPPRVLVQPGELSCDAAVAADAGAQRQPH